MKSPRLFALLAALAASTPTQPTRAEMWPIGNRPRGSNARARIRSRRRLPFDASRARCRAAVLGGPARSFKRDPLI